MNYPGFRVGQAANLTNDSFIADGIQPWVLKPEEWEERMEKYLPILTHLAVKYAGEKREEDEDWTDRKPEKKEIPIIVFDEDEEITSTN